MPEPLTEEEIMVIGRVVGAARSRAPLVLDAKETRILLQLLAEKFIDEILN